ncbi:MAG: hypothetical protein WED00_01750 [Aquisalimonadaceae bacterium]
MPTNVVQHERYYSKCLARLDVEGIGVNGTYYLKGEIVVRRNGTVFISAKGFTAAMDFARQNGGSVRYFARAKLIKDRAVVRAEQLSRSLDGEAWNGDHFLPIGSCTLKIPNSYPGIEYSVSIEYWYAYKTGIGIAYPIPQPAKETIQIGSPSLSGSARSSTA